MIVWLLERVSIAGRIVVTILLALVIMALFVAILAVGDSIRKDMLGQFRELREDHREIRDLMIRNTQRFGGIVEKNTEAVKKTADTVKKIHEDEFK